MATTASYDVTRAWTKVADGAGKVFIQRQSNHHVEVHLGQSTPANEQGAFTTIGREGWMSLADLVSTDKVFVRSAIQQTAKISVITG